MERNNEYLAVIDFDNTAARTMEPSPNNMGVLQAYESAIQAVLGNAGLKAYGRIGGLQNRAPIELAVALLENGDKEALIRNAKDFFEKKAPTLKRFMPAGKMIPLAWDDDSDIEISISEMIVLCKLSCYMGEIGIRFQDGRIWPELCNGFQKFFEAVREINRSGKSKIRLAILSSGHDQFIKKTFMVWGLECPEILVTDDILRRLPLDPQYKIKPARILFEIVYQEWLKKMGFPTLIINSDEMAENCRRVVYIGDDIDKDGKLAENAGILFGWFNPDNKKDGNLNGGFSFSDWVVIAKLLKRESVLKSLQKGEPLAKIFLPLMAKQKGTR